MSGPRSPPSLPQSQLSSGYAFAGDFTDGRNFKKSSLLLLIAREKNYAYSICSRRYICNQGIQHNVKDNAYQFHALIGLALYVVRGSLA